MGAAAEKGRSANGGPPSSRPHNVRRQRLERLRQIVAWTGITAFAVWILIGHLTSWEGIRWRWNWHRRHPHHAAEFSWDKIKPSSKLIYYPCFDGFECARLDVPMDWNSTEKEGGRVVIAITRLPAKVGVVDRRYGGVVLINPGGPGGSGVEAVLTSGKSVQTIIDSARSPSDMASFSEKDPSRYHDIIGFDPRGVNNTTPTLNCFPDDISRLLWNVQAQADGVLGSSDNAFALAWARSTAIGERCSLAYSGKNDDDGLAAFINTSPVVADMVAIIEAHGEWREVEAKKYLANYRGPTHCFDKAWLPSVILSHAKHRPGEEKLNYWGFSYGSLLGTTFASMQPHRVGRVVLDGIVDAHDYYATGWSTNLQDTDLLLAKLFEYCHAAGPRKCPLAASTTTPSEIRTRYTTLLTTLRESPLPVPGTPDAGPGIITYSDVKNLHRNAVYSPLSTYSSLARTLADLSLRNGTAFSACLTRERTPPGPRQPDLDEDIQCDMHEDFKYAGHGVLCADGKDITHETPETYKPYWDILRNQSELLGDEWAMIRMGCVAWKIRPKWRYTGPIGGETAGPILWLGNSRDPVTPVRNARRMAGLFSGSVVLEQDADGHCSYAAPSVCTARWVRRYFQGGELPPEETVCEVDERPLVGEVGRSKVLSWEDAVLREAVREFAGVGKGEEVGPVLG